MWLGVGDACVVSVKTNHGYIYKSQMFQIRIDLMIFKNFLAAEQILLVS